MKILWSLRTAVKVTIGAFCTGVLVGLIVAGAAAPPQPDSPHDATVDTVQHDLRF